MRRLVSRSIRYNFATAMPRPDPTPRPTRTPPENEPQPGIDELDAAAIEADENLQLDAQPSEKNGVRYGMATIAIGGGMSGAIDQARIATAATSSLRSC